MPDSKLPESDDERVDALQHVLRRNGIGGSAPFTIQGEIEQMGHTAMGTRRHGWRGLGSRLLVAALLGLIGLGVVVSAVEAIGRLL